MSSTGRGVPIIDSEAYGQFYSRYTTVRRKLSPEQISLPFDTFVARQDRLCTSLERLSLRGDRSPSATSAGPAAGLPGDSRSQFLFDQTTDQTQHNSRQKFASIIRKHRGTLSTGSTFRAETVSKPQSLTTSCPNLISPLKHERTNFRGSDSELQNIAKRRNVPLTPPNSGNKLKVPDIFTTSFTHSSPLSAKPPIPPPRSPVTYPLSVQNTHDPPTEASKLRRTTSMSMAELENLKIEHLTSGAMYKDEHVAQITEYMFVGSIEAAYNDRRLCRLDIESLVDISNLNEMQIPSNKKTQCPCLCQTEYKHFRSRLIIAVADAEDENIDQYFEEVNRFIEAARRCGRKVLIYSYEGKSRAALFAMQYMMSYEGLLLRQVYSLVKKQRPSVSLNSGFQRSLETLEKTLFPEAKPSVNICNEYLNVADPQAIKCAWVE